MRLTLTFVATVATLAAPLAARAQCDGDVNGDDVFNTTDVGIVSVCLRIPDGMYCSAADLNDDGIVNCYDTGVIDCLLMGTSPDPECCVAPPCICDCSPFVTSDDDLDMEDVMRTEMCIDRDRTGSCENADVNCDGVTDRCDVEHVRTQVSAGAYDPLTCMRMPCDRMPGTDDGGGGGVDGGGSGDGGTTRPGMVDCDCRTLPDGRSTLPTALFVLGLVLVWRRGGQDRR